MPAIIPMLSSGTGPKDHGIEYGPEASLSTIVTPALSRLIEVGGESGVTSQPRFPNARIPIVMVKRAGFIWTRSLRVALVRGFQSLLEKRTPLGALHQLIRRKKIRPHGEGFYKRSVEVESVPRAWLLGLIVLIMTPKFVPNDALTVRSRRLHAALPMAHVPLDDIHDRGVRRQDGTQRTVPC